MSELSVGSLSGLAANSYVIDVASGSSLDLSNGATLPAGSIISVNSVTKNDTFSASLASGGTTAITDLSITHTMAKASNKLLITGAIGAGSNSGRRGQFGIALADDGTLVAVGASPGNRAPVTAGGRVDGAGTDASNAVSHSFTVLYEPGDTASHTYTIHAVNNNSTTATININRSSEDSNDVNHVRSVSTLTIMEVAG